VAASVRAVCAAGLLTLLVQTGSELPLETARLPVGTWIYTFRTQGREAGEMTSVITRNQGVLVSSSRMSAGEFLQEGELTVRQSDLRPIASRTRIAAGSTRAFEAALRYRTVGDSLEVRRIVTRQDLNEGPSLPSEAIWRVVAAGTYDVQTVDLLVSALPLEEGREWSIRVVDPTTEQLGDLLIRVEGTHRLETAAGTFTVRRVVVTGGAVETRYDVDVPTRELIAQYIPDQGIEIILKTRFP
jgi:hypothetical protein